MSNKNHSGSEGSDNTTTKNKGESQQTHQKGAKSVSKKESGKNTTGKHTKDNSDGAAHNTTKKQGNSI